MADSENSSSDSEPSTDSGHHHSRSQRVVSPSPEPRRIVLITGGCGFFGVEIARHVYTHWSTGSRATTEIRLVDINPPPATVLAYITNNGGTRDGPVVSFFRADVTDRNAIRAAFVRVDVVFHCALLTETGSIMNRLRMKHVNIGGTHNVIRACLECGVRCLVFPGSILQVLTTRSVRQHFIDETVRVPDGEELIFPFYGHTVTEAENQVILANNQVTDTGTILHTCSLRFPPFYGENDRRFVPFAFMLSKRCCGYFPAPANSFALMSSMYVGNAAWAQLCAAERLLDGDESNRVGGKVFYIGDDTPPSSFTEFFKEFLTPLGYRISPIRIPLLILLIIAYIFEFISICLYWVGIDYASTWNRGSIKLVRTSHSIRWEKARAMLRYKPLYAFGAALARSMPYYRTRWARR